MDLNDKDLYCGWEIENPEHSAIYKKAEPLLQTRFNTIHTRIAYHFAVTLLEKSGGDQKVVIPAILLHDIGWSIIPETRQKGAFGPDVKKSEVCLVHETEGARVAGEILADLRYPADCILEIQKIISEHDTRPEPFNTNDAIVKDADKLWRYTNEGFSIDYQRFGKTKHEHLIWLVKNIPKWFLSRTSMILAQNEALQRKAEHGIELDWQGP